jgi:hypothetical protein
VINRHRCDYRGYTGDAGVAQHALLRLQLGGDWAGNRRCAFP